MQGAGRGEVQPAVVNFRGSVKEVNWEIWTAGEKAPVTLMLTCRDYKLESAGSTVHDIDIENMNRIIDGVDQPAEMRAALGL